MRKERLQNHISGSVFTLPVCAFIICVLWWFPFTSSTGSLFDRLNFDQSHFAALALVALTAYVLIEMNNVNILIRVRTRMVSSIWLVSAAVIESFHNYSSGLVAAFFLALAFHLMFSTYQHRDCQASTFHYAVAIGVASIFVPFCVALLPLFLWHQTFFLRSMSIRSLCAAIVGFIFPWILWVSYCVYKEYYTYLTEWVSQLTTYYPIQWDSYTQLTYHQIASWGMVSLWTFIGAIHYLSTTYYDKIQVRMMLYSFVIIFFFVEAFIALQPQNLDVMLPMLTMAGAPLMAHFYALTKSWFTNSIFVLSVMAYIALGYFNLFSQA